MLSLVITYLNKASKFFVDKDLFAYFCFMERMLSLYIDKNGEQHPFKDVVITSFNADYKRMGGAPTITCKVKHPTCLDNEWSYGVYTIFNGERFYLKQIPSSSFSNIDARYIHDLELCSERIQLDHVFVFDVTVGGEVDKPVSNNTDFSFFGTITDFAEKLNSSLKYSGLQSEDGNDGYRVIVDDGVTSEGKLISISNNVFSEVLQESFKTFEVPYYFKGKEIHLGFSSNYINDVVFEYGVNNSLLSVEKQNENSKVVNRITATGSEDNLPYYYPNKTSLGDVYLTYNGKKDLAFVADQAKFSKNNLSSVFEYKRYPASETIVSSNKKLLSTEWEYTGGYWQGIPEVSLQYEVDINITSDRLGTLTIDVRDLNWFSFADIHVVLYSFINGEEKEYARWHATIDSSPATIDNPKQFVSAAKGRYRCVVTMEAITQSELTEYFDLYSFFIATYSVEETSYWTLDGKSISSLSQYGILTYQEPKDGDKILIVQDDATWLVPQKKLMPPLYRDTFGTQRFYNAIDGKYVNQETGGFYSFNNEYVEGNPREHIVEFEDIKPTIVGVTNAKGNLINSFIEFAYDENDNDEIDEEGNLLHPYFFAKLHKIDGANGFNLFHHAIESGEMTISMTSGSCGACNWVIGVDSNNKMNPVQVYEEEEVDKDGTIHPKGSLKRDDSGDVICGRKGAIQVQDIQQDTINHEVWIALAKDNGQTFHAIMPNATNNYKPTADNLDENGLVTKRGDTFVILNIHLPHAYILAAEQRLEEEMIKYLAENNDEKFVFSVGFSRIYLAQHPDVLSQLNENARINLRYNNIEYVLYVNSFSYAMQENSSLPDIKVTLSHSVELGSNAIQNAVSQVETKVTNQIASLDIVTLAAPFFHRKDVKDETNSSQSFTDGISVGKNKEFGFSGDGTATVNKLKTKTFTKGYNGAAIYEEEGNSYMEADFLNVRKKASFKDVEIETTKHIGGKQILSAAECKCDVVEQILDSNKNIIAFKVYFRKVGGDGSLINNKWERGDQARCDTFNVYQNSNGEKGNRFYWRLVTDVGSGGYNSEQRDMAEYHWIVLSNQENEQSFIDDGYDGSGYDANSDAPIVGDDIVQLGNRFGTTGRTAVIEIAGAGTDSPYIRQFENITTFHYGDIDTQIKPGDNKFKGRLEVSEGSKGIGLFSDLPDEVNRAVKIGGENLLRNTGFDGDYSSQKMEEFEVIGSEDKVYGQNLEFWTVSDKTKVKSVESTQSVSGYECRFFSIGSWISQDITLIQDEDYVLSFVCKGVVNVRGEVQGEESKTTRCRVKVVGSGEVQTIRFESASLGASIWDVKLERGKVQTDWCPAREDNDKMAGEFKDLWYLQHAFKGKTEILGGLILSSLIQLGMFRNGEMEGVTAGISGILEDQNTDVAFWGGGTLQQANNAVTMFRDNPLYQPTDDELNNIAKAVITHAGRAILNDVVLRGYVYAEGGVFRGDVNAKRLIVNRTNAPISGNTGLIVDSAYITGRGIYILPELEDGQMVSVKWFNPAYVKYSNTSPTTKFIGENDNVLITNKADNIVFNKSVTFGEVKTLYEIIGDHPVGKDYTYWSIVTIADTIGGTSSGGVSNWGDQEDLGSGDGLIEWEDNTGSGTVIPLPSLPSIQP